MIDFTKENEYKVVVEGFETLDPFGPLHIIIDDGNVEDNHINFCKGQTSDRTELCFLDNLQKLPLNMRSFAYEYSTNKY